MKSTPPIAFFSTSRVFGAVWPMYCPTRSSRVTGDEVAFAHVSEAVEDLRHAHRDCRLPGAGIAREAHVQRRRSGREVEAAAQAIDEEQRRNLADARLDRLEPDELAIELIEHLLDLRFLEDRRQIHGTVAHGAGAKPFGDIVECGS
jgi:hypothetical protein